MEASLLRLDRKLQGAQGPVSELGKVKYFWRKVYKVEALGHCLRFSVVLLIS